MTNVVTNRLQLPPKISNKPPLDAQAGGSDERAKRGHTIPFLEGMSGHLAYVMYADKRTANEGGFKRGALMDAECAKGHSTDL